LYSIDLNFDGRIDRCGRQPDAQAHYPATYALTQADGVLPDLVSYKSMDLGWCPFASDVFDNQCRPSPEPSTVCRSTWRRRQTKGWLARRPAQQPAAEGGARAKEAPRRPTHSRRFRQPHRRLGPRRHTQVPSYLGPSTHSPYLPAGPYRPLKHISCSLTTTYRTRVSKVLAVIGLSELTC
jgi:hypothetical protein